MTHQATIEPDPNPPASLQEEINMLRAMNRKAYAMFEECQSVSDKVRFVATISMSCTRVGSLLKIERQLAGGEDANPTISEELERVLREMESGQ